MATEYDRTTYRTCGTDSAQSNLRFTYCELKEGHVPNTIGTIKQIIIPNRLDDSYYGSDGEQVYLGIWRRLSSGEEIKLGVSRNTVVHTTKMLSVFEFDGVPSTGESIILGLITHPDGHYTETVEDLGGRGHVGDEDGCWVYTKAEDRTQYNTLVDIIFTIEYAVEVPDEPTPDEPEPDIPEPEPEPTPQEETLREVRIEEYWPLIVKNTAEFDQIAVAENPEFNNMAACIFRVLKDAFILEATEYGVERWEKMLGITPSADATLDERKVAILTHLSVKAPYTWRVLKQMLVPILGGEDKFVMEYLNDEAKLVLHTDRLDDSMLASVTALLERVLPQNIEVEHSNYMSMSYIVKKLPSLLNDALGGTGRHNLNYDEENDIVTVELAYPNLDDESKSAVEGVFNNELPPEVSSSIKYGVTDYVVDYLLNDYDWPNEKDQWGSYNRLQRIFPGAKYKPQGGFELPKDMPFPERLAKMTDINSLFGKVPIIKLPDAWLFENVTNASGMFEGYYWGDGGPYGHTLRELPQGITFNNVTKAPFLLRHCAQLKELPESITFAKLRYGRMAFMHTTFKSTPKGVTFDKLIDGDYLYSNTPCVEVDEAVNFASLKQGELMFNTCKLDKRSAIQILTTIPTWTSGTHLLCLGIHVDHQNDEEVLAAIANAEAKGWTLTVQWNGTPTSTASTMAMGQLIYAKVDEHELPDGTTERVLDWGHYVTDETGYETFRSLESAYKYFNLEIPENE